ncbi:hypothetical protein C2S51_003681 [Perilla frutescens var. frutescens]|nr:hypothetical protein C2S51_003681 [Perilla frutescens var. frutescens]
MMQLVEAELEVHLSTTTCGGNQTLMHIAAWFDQSKVVSMLMEVSPTMCWLRNSQGMNPIHVAVMNGSLNVLSELLAHSPSCALERLDGGLTVFHLCVRHHRLGALELLYHSLGGFVGMQDNQGETPLHLAVRLRGVEVVAYLVGKTTIDPLTQNAKGQTALDVLRQCDSHSSSGNEIEFIKDTLQPFSPKSVVPDESWFAKKRDSLIVVAGLIATMAFQATVSPPGGVWQEDAKEKKAGEAVMGHSQSFDFFMATNSIAFITSLTTLLLLFIGVPFKNRRSFMLLLAVVMFISLITVSFTYVSSVSIIIPEIKKSVLYTTILSGIYIWMAVVTTCLLWYFTADLRANRFSKFHKYFN